MVAILLLIVWIFLLSKDDLTNKINENIYIKARKERKVLMDEINSLKKENEELKIKLTKTIVEW